MLTSPSADEEQGLIVSAGPALEVQLLGQRQSIVHLDA
jgi:hypothetical protein